MSFDARLDCLTKWVMARGFSSAYKSNEENSLPQSFLSENQRIYVKNLIKDSEYQDLLVEARGKEKASEEIPEPELAQCELDESTEVVTKHLFDLGSEIKDLTVKYESCLERRWFSLERVLKETRNLFNCQIEKTTATDAINTFRISKNDILKQSIQEMGDKVAFLIKEIEGVKLSVMENPRLLNQLNKAEATLNEFFQEKKSSLQDISEKLDFLLLCFVQDLESIDSQAQASVIQLNVTDWIIALGYSNGNGGIFQRPDCFENQIQMQYALNIHLEKEYEKSKEEECVIAAKERRSPRAIPPPKYHKIKALMPETLKSISTLVECLMKIGSDFCKFNSDCYSDIEVIYFNLKEGLENIQSDPDVSSKKHNLEKIVSNFNKSKEQIITPIISMIEGKFNFTDKEINETNVALGDSKRCHDLMLQLVTARESNVKFSLEKKRALREFEEELSDFRKKSRAAGNDLEEIHVQGLLEILDRLKEKFNPKQKAEPKPLEWESESRALDLKVNELNEALQKAFAESKNNSVERIATERDTLTAEFQEKTRSPQSKAVQKTIEKLAKDVVCLIKTENESLDDLFLDKLSEREEEDDFRSADVTPFFGVCEEGELDLKATTPSSMRVGSETSKSVSSEKASSTKKTTRVAEKAMPRPLSTSSSASTSTARPLSAITPRSSRSSLTQTPIAVTTSAVTPRSGRSSLTPKPTLEEMQEKYKNRYTPDPSAAEVQPKKEIEQSRNWDKVESDSDSVKTDASSDEELDFFD